MIVAQALTKKFDQFTAVDALTFRVHAGEILALLGPNGAGKTTTVRLLAAILNPTSGRATVAGFDVVREARAVRQHVGVLTEMPGLYLRMTAVPYLDFFGRLWGLSARQRVERSESLLRRFGLWETRRQRIGEYSKGMKQKLAIIHAMLHDPPVLLLDEPTSAMDPHSAKLVRDAIVSLRDERRAIVVCTHNLAEAELLADRIAIIRLGRLVLLGTPRELKAQLLGPSLMEVRLTGSEDGLAPRLADIVQVEAQGEGWFCYRTTDPTDVNPRLLRRLAALGQQVVTISEVPRTLEDVYLQVVEEPS
ncbi:MAG: ABC transporter ATP-binding protein [Anaerolineae bacterium]|nr:MAG: ABC transporter ATP-binding protein [Anaerolineae bacterium]